MDCMRAWLNGEPYKPDKKGFMGQTWDAWVPGPEVWKECYRVLKPGGHMLVFAGTRSFDLMTLSLRLSGFELRDTLMWIYGCGFPKGLNISKAIDREAGVEREKILVPTKPGNTMEMEGDISCGASGFKDVSEPVTEEAKRWVGWGTALKPAWEPIILVKKPVTAGTTIAANVKTYGTGGLNIADCRIGDEVIKTFGKEKKSNGIYGSFAETLPTENIGRYPANLIHDGSTEVMDEFKVYGESTSVPRTTETVRQRGVTSFSITRGTTSYSDSGFVSRFFYCAKASKEDREEGCEELDKKKFIYSKGGVQDEVDIEGMNLGDGGGMNRLKERCNIHPTVKPTELMRYLCRLVTPPDGVVLDPFMGSGSTGKGAVAERFRFVGIDVSPDYAKIAEARIKFATEKTRTTPVQLTFDL